MSIKSRKDILKERAAKVNIIVHTHSPGDGVTRYRFFNDMAVDDYCGGDSGTRLDTVFGISNAEKWLDAFICGYYLGEIRGFMQKKTYVSSTTIRRDN